MEEIWLDIKKYEGLYQVSNLSNIRNTKTKVVLTQSLNKYGYLTVGLYKNGFRTYHKVHRLVAEAFIPNPDNLPQVNHKDENKQNNVPENLEWCDAKYNMTYGTRLDKIKKKLLQIDKDTDEVIREWSSVTDAAHTLGIPKGSISNVCLSKRRTTGGFKWSYSSEP